MSDPGRDTPAPAPATADVPAVLGLFERALSAACAASVRAAVKLDLPDALGDEPATSAALAAAVEADPGALHRLLHTLTCYGVFAETAEGTFVHTDTSRLLRRDAPFSLRHLALWLTEPWSWELWGHLDEAVRTGTDVFARLHGSEFFEHIHRCWPETAEVFALAMTEQSAVSAAAIADSLGLAPGDTVADVGGGRGLVLATILERNPGTRGVLFDLPGVVAGADTRLGPGGSLSDRAEVVAGDCRERIPVVADTYLFKNILGWEDQSVRILANAADAAAGGARVAVVENFVDSGPGQLFSSAMDLRMMLSAGGRKHRREDMVALVERAGLEIDDVAEVNSYLHVVRARVR